MGMNLSVITTMKRERGQDVVQEQGVIQDHELAQDHDTETEGAVIDTNNDRANEQDFTKQIR